MDNLYLHSILAIGALWLVIVFVLPIVIQILIGLKWFVFEEEKCSINPIHKFYFTKILKCTHIDNWRGREPEYSDESWMGDRKYFFSSDFTSAEYYLMGICNTVVLYCTLAVVYNLPLTSFCVIVFICGMYVLRWIARLGKKMVKLSKALNNHVENKSIHSN